MDKAKPSKLSTIARIWRGRTSSAKADEYQRYVYDHGIRPLEEKALAVQLLREDRAGETEFITISYWEDVQAMSRFAGLIRHASITLSGMPSCSSSCRAKSRFFAFSRVTECSGLSQRCLTSCSFQRCAGGGGERKHHAARNEHPKPMGRGPVGGDPLVQ